MFKGLREEDCLTKMTMMQRGKIPAVDLKKGISESCEGNIWNIFPREKKTTISATMFGIDHMHTVRH